MYRWLLKQHEKPYHTYICTVRKAVCSHAYVKYTNMYLKKNSMSHILRTVIHMFISINCQQYLRVYAPSTFCTITAVTNCHRCKANFYVPDMHGSVIRTTICCINRTTIFIAVSAQGSPSSHTTRASSSRQRVIFSTKTRVSYRSVWRPCFYRSTITRVSYGSVWPYLYRSGNPGKSWANTLVRYI